MKKITITGDFSFSDEQKTRLQTLGEVTQATYASADEWLAAVQGSDVILSDGEYLLENLEKLQNVFVAYRYVELGAFDSEKLKEKGVYVANARGGNRDSIVEWAMFAVLSLFRKFPEYVNIRDNRDFVLTESLAGKKVLIVGKGSIGTAIGAACNAFHMEVDYYTRQDDLKAKSASVDLVINALSTNASSKNLLDETFFMNLKPGSYFVTFARPHTYDIDGVCKSIDSGILAGAAIDCDPEEPYDTTNAFYKKCVDHGKILVTPHIAFATTQASVQAKEITLQNVETYLRGEPQNILTKI